MALLLQLRCLRWSSRIVPSSPSTINCRYSPKSEFLHAGRLGSAQAILQAVLKPRITQELLQGGGSHALLVHFRRPFPLTPRSLWRHWPGGRQGWVLWTWPPAVPGHSLDNIYWHSQVLIPTSLSRARSSETNITARGSCPIAHRLAGPCHTWMQRPQEFAPDQWQSARHA